VGTPGLQIFNYQIFSVGPMSSSGVSIGFGIGSTFPIPSNGRAGAPSAPLLITDGSESRPYQKIFPFGGFGKLTAGRLRAGNLWNLLRRSACSAGDLPTLGFFLCLLVFFAASLLAFASLTSCGEGWVVKIPRSSSRLQSTRLPNGEEFALPCRGLDDNKN
jgi:hypothetical protein